MPTREKGLDGVDEEDLGFGSCALSPSWNHLPVLRGPSEASASPSQLSRTFTLHQRRELLSPGLCSPACDTVRQTEKRLDNNPTLSLWVGPYIEGSSVPCSRTDSPLQFLEHSLILHIFGFSHGLMRKARQDCYSHFTDGNMEAQRCEWPTGLPRTVAGLELGPSDPESRNPFCVLQGC